jgi:hypothetical protein
LKRVAFASVNPDSEGQLSQQLIGSGPIPQLVMFRNTPRGWVRRVMVGSQSVENVEAFINQGIAVDEDEAKSVDAAKANAAIAPKPADEPREQPKA